VDKQIVDAEKELGELGPHNCRTMAMVIDMWINKWTNKLGMQKKT
jgi:hypothetical protein